MENLGTSGMSLPRIPLPTRIGTSHGELRHFGFGVWRLSLYPPEDTVSFHRCTLHVSAVAATIPIVLFTSCPNLPYLYSDLSIL